MDPIPTPEITERAEATFVGRSNDAGNKPNHNRTGSTSSSTTSGSSDGDDFFQIDPNDLRHPLPSGAREPVHALPPLPPSARNDVPDPHRIPSSIFARTNTTNPTEWSVASNESLFSIQMGNSSFSRDPIFPRSGELTNFSGHAADGYGLPPLSPTSPVPTTFPPAMTKPTPISTVPVSPGVAEVNNADATNEGSRVAAEEEGNPDKEKPGLNTGTNSLNYSVGASRPSDSSISSTQSFAFPILTGEGMSLSVKAEPEHQQMKPQQIEQQAPKSTEIPSTTPAAVEEKGWLSCFSCCQP